MKTQSISGSTRTSIGKKDTVTLRKEGKVPCVVYGGKEQVHFSALEKDFRKLVYTPEVHLIKLEVNGKQIDAIFKEIQYHPVTDSILHVDFMEVLPDKPIVMQLPVKLEGTAVGVKEGGKLLNKLPKVLVKGLISKIPGVINLNIESLKIGDTIRIKDFKHDGLTFLHEQNATVVAVKTAREVVEETSAAATPAAGAASAAATPAAGATPAAPEKDDKKTAEKKK